MLTLLRSDDVRDSPDDPTVKVEGEAYDAGTTVFFTRGRDVGSPALHQHQYSETFVVVTGRVSITGGEQTVEATGGDIVIVPPRTPHTFTHLDREELIMVHIHANPRSVTEWL